MSKSTEYSQALAEALHKNTAGDVDAVLSNTQQLLKRAGHAAMYPSVVRGALKLLERNEKVSGATVILANEDEGSANKDRIAVDLANAGVVSYRTRQDHTLISGYVVVANGVRYDRSVRRRLVNLYGALTSAK